MLGPGPVDPSDTDNIPLHMLVSNQKLHPGSGCLTVRVQMDGPVRVLQIADIRHRVGTSTNSMVEFTSSSSTFVACLNNIHGELFYYPQGRH